MKNVFLPEKNCLNIGFMPLTDCAPLVVAKEMGFFSQWGLKVKLEKQPNWTTLRDKLHHGELDAAQILAPMPFSSTLGIGCRPQAMISPMVLSRNGNAITISNHLQQQLLSTNNLKKISLPLSAQLLSAVTKEHQLSGTKLRFATVSYYSCHYYQLRDWLQSSNIHEDSFEVVVMPPSQMVHALANGDIDGFCVGGPWNAKAVREGVGLTALTSSDIWPDSPEKVLGMMASWQLQRPETTMALIAALQQACNWLETVPNRFEAARLLSQPQYIGLEIDVIAPSLLGSCLTQQDQGPRFVPSYNQFSAQDKYPGNSPEHSYGEWLIKHMSDWGHIDKSLVNEGLVASVFRQDIYQAVSDIVFNNGPFNNGLARSA